MNRQPISKEAEGGVAIHLVLVLVGPEKSKIQTKILAPYLLSTKPKTQTSCPPRQIVPRMMLVLLLFGLLVGVVGNNHNNSGNDPCPCSDPAWCRPVPISSTRHNGELFGFIDSNSKNDYDYMNWTYVSTIAWGDDALTCLAHQHGVKSVLAAPPMDFNKLATPASRTQWAQQALQLVQSKFRDGLVFDYEQPANGARYAAVITETARLFRENNNNSYSITTCVPWSPANIDGRAYPWREIALASDFLYVMDYDTRSQVTTEGFCLAGPNAPYAGMVQGMELWRQELLENANDEELYRKMILGVPWYGYLYPCLPGTPPQATYCPIPHVPFRGVNCSDAAGTQIAYNKLLPKIDNATIRRGESGSPYFNEGDDGNVLQYWYDDAASLRRKYAWARRSGLAGVGPFAFHYLADIQESDAAVEMWSAFDDYFVTANERNRDKTDSLMLAS